MRRLALLAALLLAPLSARADLECEYMAFQMSDVENDQSVALCECGRFVALGDTIRVVARTLVCTSEGWRTGEDYCLDEVIAVPDPELRHQLAADRLRQYNESFRYCY